jgi:hypothetical protein
MSPEIRSLNHNLVERLRGLASMIEAYEMAAEFKESGSNKDLDFWSMITNTKYVVAGVMDVHQLLSDQIEELP